MLALIMPFLSALLGGLDKIFGYVADVETTKLTTEAATEQVQINAVASVEKKWWFVALLLPMFAIPYGIYDAKCVVWDNVIMGGHSSTPALHGSLDTINWIIVTGLFMYGFKYAR